MPATALHVFIDRGGILKGREWSLQCTRKNEFKGKEGWKGEGWNGGEDGREEMEDSRRMEWLNGSGRIRGRRKDGRERMDGWRKKEGWI